MAALPIRQRLLHPLHAILLAFPIALFSSALASDIAYLNSAEIQWTNFSQWLLAGGCLMGGLTLLWAIFLLVRAGAAEDDRIVRIQAVAYLLLLASMWTSGLLNSFLHSRDGWSSVGATGLSLSIFTTLTALAAGWVGYAGVRIKGAKRAEGTRP